MGKFDGILLLSDIDGTIAEDGVISEENQKAVEYFKENGGMFAYASGRIAGYIENLSVKANVPVIGTTGTTIYDCEKHKMLFEFPMPKSVTQVISKIIDTFPIERWYTFTKTGSVYIEGDDLSVPEDFDREMYKVVFVFKQEADAVAAKERFSQEYKELAFERSYNVFLEMRIASAGKGYCLKKLKEITGARIVIAAGNYENDIEMLEEADISYVPSDAIDSAKAVADKMGVAFNEHLIDWIVKDIEKTEGLMCR